MGINDVQENPKAVFRHEHAATRLQLEETLGTFNGSFMVTLLLNEAVKRLTFGYVIHASTFNDVRVRLHVLEPFVQPGKQPSTISTSTPLLCHEGFAIHGTVNVLCSIHNWLSSPKS